MLTKSDFQKIRQGTREEIVKELKPIKEDISKIRKDMNEIIGFFDKEYLDLRKRVERIEEHLHLLPQN